MSVILESELTEIETYEDCPCDVDLLVWAYDEWQIEHVIINEDGAFSPANGVEFTHYAELPSCLWFKCEQ